MKWLIGIGVLWVHATGFSFGSPQAGPRANSEEAISESFLSLFIENDQLYLNIPKHLMDRPMLFIRYDHTRDEKYMQVVWSVQGDKILLKKPRIHSTSGVIMPILPKLHLEDNILSIFPKAAELTTTESYCINITDLILRQDIAWSLGFSESVVPQISLLLGVKNADNEVIVNTRRGIEINGSKMAIPIHFAFCALPDPMKARRYDYRMGFYNEKKRDIPYDLNNSVANINRWRLEKMDNTQNSSLPKKPITFILSPDIPGKWRPYIKAGLNEWLPAFEAAGFKEAIKIREVDSLTNWDQYSIHNSIVYWSDRQLFRGSENDGYGGTVGMIIDERTGEVLKGDIYLGGSSRNYMERYFIRAAPVDKRARKFPFPDDVLGSLFQDLVAHEAGHIFGMMDANYGEFTYPFEKMNDEEWLRSMGHTPSIMNYTRINNLTQPQDSISPRLLNQKVGPTDNYYIRWGYTEFPSGTTEEEEEAALERIIREQDNIPWYRFVKDHYEVIGPGKSSEVVESRDPIKATAVVLANLKRVIELLPEACSDQKDNARLVRIYDKILELWFSQMLQVASLIGGYEVHYKSINQKGNIYTPIPRQVQEQALEFIILNCFNPPHWLINPEFNDKIMYSTNFDKMMEYQQTLILKLLRSHRLKRFEYMENRPGYEWMLEGFLAKLQQGLFKEVDYNDRQIAPKICEIQLTYIDRLVWVVKQERVNIITVDKVFDYSDYSKGVILGQLSKLKKEIKRNLNKNKSWTGHWKLCLLKLEDIP